MAKRHLGRGFESLMNGETKGEKGSRKLALTIEIPLDRIVSNPWQPRNRFDEEKLKELSASISQTGVLSPILVRREGDKYVLIAGERRLKASKMAGLQRIPAIVRDVTDVEMLELSLIENIQRSDLNPLDKAKGYYELMKKFHLTQEQVAEKIGVPRSTVANHLRLLNLHGYVQAALLSGDLTMGHARAIGACEIPNEQLRLCKLAVSQRLSVREVEALAAEVIEDAPRRRRTKARREEVDPAIVDIEAFLRRYFGTKVTVKHKGSKGKIVIDYFSTSDLNRIIALLESEGFRR